MLTHENIGFGVLSVVGHKDHIPRDPYLTCRLIVNHPGLSVS